MQAEFWQQRWQQGRIGFNQPKVNPLLINYFSELQLAKASRVLVPLAGKSIDMLWLAQQGYEVIGIELVESAVVEFFAEQNIAATVSQPTADSTIKSYQGELAGQTITLWVADIFALTATDIGHIDAVYDRAALIAMPAEMRPNYSEQVCKLSGNAPQLVLTLNYDQNEWSGPPFSISSADIEHYYSARYSIKLLEDKPSTLNASPDLSVTEPVWLLKPSITA